DAVLIRSATRIDEEALSHAPKLKVVARAGVGLDREALFAALAESDAVLIRSATRIDEEALSHAPKLKVVARAGVGL
ncbi:hypothetical protein CTI14_69360, partial [Methylobacterium radiotolerans]